MAQRPQADILFLIRARLDSGRDKGAPQLNKDIRVLKRAETEIVALRKEVDRMKALMPSNVELTGASRNGEASSPKGEVERLVMHGG